MRDVLLGYLTWFLMVGSLVGMCLLCSYLWGPPMADRARNFAFIGGGGALFIATTIIVFIVFVGGIIYGNAQR